MKLNQGYTSKDPRILSLFKSYPLPKQKIPKYDNKYNKNLYTELSTVNDDYDKKVLEFIRKELSTLSKSNYLSIVEKFNNALIPKTELVGIGKIFYQTLIDCEFITDELLKTMQLLRFKENGQEIIHRTVIAYLNNEFKTPTIFKDTNAESGSDKMNRVRLANAKVMAKLYVLDLKESPGLNVTNTITGFLSILITSITTDQQFNIKVLALVYKILSEKLKKEHTVEYQEYQQEIQKIANDKHYNLSYRLLLK